ncbi:MAG: ATP-binding cassette domain-containing protein [Spirosomataceae bacterium]
MLKIEAQNIGKKFKNEWVFRNLTYSFDKNSAIAITGPNGSGKSTLMQALAGMIPVNEGKVSFSTTEKNIHEEEFHQHLSFSAPYLELIEEFTLLEAVIFHKKFKDFKDGISAVDFLKQIELEKHRNKQIKFFSSGMRQRLKLGLVFYSTSEVLFFDEPTSNLDEKGFNWYKSEIEKVLNDRLILVSSNEPKEYEFCENHLNILNFK